MELQGTIKLIKDTQQVTEKFAKREFVLTIPDGDYPQDILMECIQDKCAMLDAFHVGSNVDVSLNLRGREWINPQGEAKYFNTLQVWRMKQHTEVGSTMPNIPQGMATKSADPTQFEEEADDLPF